MNIVEKIQLLCENAGTTLVGLERQLGFGRGTIRKWSISSPSIDKVSKVSKFFNISADLLIDDTQELSIGDMQENKLLDKLISETKNKKIKWIEFTFTDNDMSFYHTQIYPSFVNYYNNKQFTIFNTLFASYGDGGYLLVSANDDISRNKYYSVLFIFHRMIYTPYVDSTSNSKVFSLLTAATNQIEDIDNFISNFLKDR